jgi:hypothetical protein
MAAHRHTVVTPVMAHHRPLVLLHRLAEAVRLKSNS